MILRYWRGWTTMENADAYERIVSTEVLPGIAIRNVAGYGAVTCCAATLAAKSSSPRSCNSTRSRRCAHLTAMTMRQPTFRRGPGLSSPGSTSARFTTGPAHTGPDRLEGPLNNR
jgi:hypothetical protein